MMSYIDIKLKLHDNIQFLYNCKDNLSELDDKDNVFDYLKHVDFLFEKLDDNFQVMFHDVFTKLVDNITKELFCSDTAKLDSTRGKIRLQKLILYLDVLNNRSFDTNTYRKSLIDRKLYVIRFIDILNNIILFGKYQNDQQLYGIFEDILNLCLSIIEKITRNAYKYDDIWKRYNLFKLLISISNLGYMDEITNKCSCIIRNMCGFDKDDDDDDEAKRNNEIELNDSDDAKRDKWKSGISYVIQFDKKADEMIDNHAILIELLNIGSYDKKYEFGSLEDETQTNFIQILNRFSEDLYQLILEILYHFEIDNSKTEIKATLIKLLAYLNYIFENIISKYSKNSFEFCMKYNETANGLKLMFNLLSDNTFLNFSGTAQDRIFKYLQSKIIDSCCKSLCNLKYFANRFKSNWTALDSNSGFSLCRVALDSYESNINDLYDIIPFTIVYSDDESEVQYKFLKHFYKCLSDKNEETKINFIENAIEILEIHKNAPGKLLQSRIALLALECIDNCDYNVLCESNKALMRLSSVLIPHLISNILAILQQLNTNQTDDMNLDYLESLRIILIKYNYFSKLILRRIMNITNDSLDFCVYIHEAHSNDIRAFLEIMKNKFLIGFYMKNQSSSILKYLIAKVYFVFFGSLFNISKVAYKYKEIWRSMDAFNTLLKLGKKLGKLNQEFEVMACMIIANIASNDDLNNFSASIRTVTKITNLLEDFSSLYNKNLKPRKTKYLSSESYNNNVESVLLNGWNLVEVIQALYKYCVSDCIKGLFYDTLNGKEYLRGIIYNGNQVEQEYAFKLLEQLCFDTKVAAHISNDLVLMKLINKIIKIKNKIIRKDLVKYCEGILWLLDKDQRKVANVEDTTIQKHIMISYDSENSPVCISIKEKLESVGYKVWINEETENGSNVADVTSAIKNAWCVLICMSEKYKESANCRLEAEYVVQLKKPFIPLIMQKKFRPDGWLESLLGTRIYIDFTKYNFDESMSRIFKELNVHSQLSGVTINWNETIDADDKHCDTGTNDQKTVETKNEQLSSEKQGEIESVKEILNEKIENTTSENKDTNDVESIFDQLSKLEINISNLKFVRKIKLNNRTQPDINQVLNNTYLKPDISQVLNNTYSKEIPKEKVHLNIVLEWTELDVENWLEEKGISVSIKQDIMPCDGKVLEQLSLMSNDVPNFFYSTIRSDTKATLREIAVFTSELRKLFKKHMVEKTEK